MTSVIGYTLFETAIGSCGVAWSARGIVRFSLPETSPARTRARLLRNLPSVAEAVPPPEIAAAIARVQRLLRDGDDDLQGIVLDEDGMSAFERSVYALARAIPPGKVLTYGEMATKLGDAGAARAVAQALSRNPVPVIVPCHRIVAAGGGDGGFSAPGGVDTKRRLLGIERVPGFGEPNLFDFAEKGA